jgi:hypothetical protein
MELEDEVAVRHDVELLELVEQREQVERHLIVWKRLERPVEHAARFGLVAGAHQVQPEIAARSDVGGVEVERAARQRDRLVESIVARGQIAGDAIDLAELRIDREDAGGLCFEGGLIAADVRDRAEQGSGVEVRRVGAEHLVDAIARRIVTRVVEIEIGQEQLRVRELGVNRQRLLGCRRRNRRIFAGERVRHAKMGRCPVLISRDDLLKRLQRLGRVVGFEKELAPCRLDGRVAGSGGGPK